MTPTQLIGPWELQSFEVETNGTLLSWGESCRGLLLYTADGHVSVGINRNVGLKNFDVIKDSLFYAGTFSLQGNRIIHQIIVASSKERIDAELIREAELHDGQLTLIGTSDRGRPFCLVWKRK